MADTIRSRKGLLRRVSSFAFALLLMTELLTPAKAAAGEIKELPVGAVAGMPDDLVATDQNGKKANSATGEYFYEVENMVPYTNYTMQVSISNMRQDAGYHIYFYVEPVDQSGDIDLVKECTCTFALDGQVFYSGRITGDPHVATDSVRPTQEAAAMPTEQNIWTYIDNKPQTEEPEDSGNQSGEIKEPEDSGNQSGEIKEPEEQQGSEVKPGNQESIRQAPFRRAMNAGIRRAAPKTTDLNGKAYDLGNFGSGDVHKLSCTIVWEGDGNGGFIDGGSRLVDGDGTQTLRAKNGKSHVEGRARFRWVFYATVDPVSNGRGFTLPHTGILDPSMQVYLVLILLVLAGSGYLLYRINRQEQKNRKNR